MHFNIFYLSGLLLLAFAAGFLLRSAQLRLHRRKVLELEREMLSNHAQILELEKEKAGLVKQLKELKIPVIQINATKDEQEHNENRKVK